MFLWRRRAIRAALIRYTGLVQSLEPMVGRTAAAGARLRGHPAADVDRPRGHGGRGAQRPGRDGLDGRRLVRPRLVDGAARRHRGARRRVGRPGRRDGRGRTTTTWSSDGPMAASGSSRPPERGSMTATQPIAVLRGSAPDIAVISRPHRSLLRAGRLSDDDHRSRRRRRPSCSGPTAGARASPTTSPSRTSAAAPTASRSYVADEGDAGQGRGRRLRPAVRLRALRGRRGRGPRWPTTSRSSSRAHAVPTQMSSYEVVERGAAAGIVITASHNPWVDNGFKVKAPTGAAAGAGHPLGHRGAPRGQRRATRSSAGPFADAEAAGLVERFDPFDGYETFVRRTVDLDALRAADIDVLVDPMCGAGLGLDQPPPRRRRDPGAPRSTRSATRTSGASIPSRSGRTSTRRWRCSPAAGTTSRCSSTAMPTGPGAADERGTFIHQLQVTGLLMYYLAEHRGWRDPVVVSVNNTSMAARLGERYGIATHETPVGLQVHRPEDDRDRRDDGRRGIGRVRVRDAPPRARRDLRRPAAARPVPAREGRRTLAGLEGASRTSTRSPGRRSTGASTSTSTEPSTPRSSGGCSSTSRRRRRRSSPAQPVARTRRRSTRTTASSSSSRTARGCSSGRRARSRSCASTPRPRRTTRARRCSRRRAAGARHVTDDGRRPGPASRSPGVTSSSGPTRTGTSARSSSSRPAAAVAPAARDQGRIDPGHAGRLRLYLEDDDGVLQTQELGPGEHRRVRDRTDPSLRGHRALRAHRGVDARARRRGPARGRLRSRGDERALSPEWRTISGGDRRRRSRCTLRARDRHHRSRCMTGRRPRERPSGRRRYARRCTAP